MRVFIGIKLTPQASEAILSNLKPYVGLKTPIRWVAQESIHLTLKFLGELTPDLFARAIDSLGDDWSKHSPFDATIGGFGKFPPGPGPGLTIFWVGMEPQAKLVDLYSDIEARLADFSFKRENRPFVPHITLGRNKARFNFKCLQQQLESQMGSPSASMSVTAFQVFQSTLTPHGPVYSVLKEIPLG